jgi:serine/threonine protein kinase
MDRYELGESIGEGAFGIVFMAHKKGSQMKVRRWREDEGVAANIFWMCRMPIADPRFLTPAPLLSLATQRKNKHIYSTQRAIKRIKKHNTWEGLRNMRELRSLLSLPPHANIVQLLEVIREDSLIHFVFELMPGGSLKEVIAHHRNRTNERRLLPPPSLPVVDDAVSILHQVLLGVQHLHDHHIYHRDLKPGPYNI